MQQQRRTVRKPAPKPPLRVGAPASLRNFLESSASGAVSGTSSPTSASSLVLKIQGEQAIKRKKELWGESYVESEDSIRNDYATHYVETRSRPQNHLRGADLSHRFSEYPKLRSLLQHKHSLLSSPSFSIPPTYLPLSPSVAFPVLPSQSFDVILLSPPSTVSYSELAALDLSLLASTPGFVFLWVGSGQKGDGVGLEQGRELLSDWGYRRCEDIVWLKSNRSSSLSEQGDRARTGDDLFVPTVEHCLMGIRGTVRRSNDPWFVHCNVDTDVMVWEGDPQDSKLKPPELQTLIENFCLGTRRLHLFGSPHSLRRGWLTVGEDLKTVNDRTSVLVVKGEESGPTWSAEKYERGRFEQIREAVPSLLPFVEEIDHLRPKSPPARDGLPSSGGLGRGRGAGLGVTRSTVIPATSNSRPPPRGRGLPFPRPTPAVVGFNPYNHSQQQQHQHYPPQSPNPQYFHYHYQSQQQQQIYHPQFNIPPMQINAPTPAHATPPPPPPPPPPHWPPTSFFPTPPPPPPHVMNHSYTFPPMVHATPPSQFVVAPPSYNTTPPIPVPAGYVVPNTGFPVHFTSPPQPLVHTHDYRMHPNTSINGGGRIEMHELTKGVGGMSFGREDGR